MDPEIGFEDFYGLKRVIVRADLSTSFKEALRLATEFARENGREMDEDPADLPETDLLAGRRVYRFRLKDEKGEEAN